MFYIIKNEKNDNRNRKKSKNLECGLPCRNIIKSDRYLPIYPTKKNVCFFTIGRQPE